MQSKATKRLFIVFLLVLGVASLAAWMHEPSPARTPVTQVLDAAAVAP